MKLVLFLSQPGAGKHTVCQQLVAQDTTNTLVHFSVDDMVRTEIAKKKNPNNNLATQIQSFVDKNQLIPDKLLAQLVGSRLTASDLRDKTVLLSNFPRTKKQATLLLDIFPGAATAAATIDRVVLLQCPDEVSLTRIKGRLFDAETNTVYNKSSNMPEDEDVAKRLVARPIDVDEAAVHHRIAEYHQQIDQVVAPFVGKIFTVRTTQPIFQVVARAGEALAAPILEGEELLKNGAGIKKGAAFAFARVGGQWVPKPLAVGQGAPLMADDADNGAGAAAVAEEGAAAASASTSNNNNSNDISFSVGKSPVRFPGEDTTERVTVRVSVPADLPPRAVDICAVLDTSGSMSISSKAQSQQDSNVEVDSGFSRLDLALHGIRTIISMLGDEDRLSIVAYNDFASSVLPLTSMTAAGKRAALDALDNGGIEADRGTDISAGIVAGLDSLCGVRSARNKFMVLLTDGESGCGIDEVDAVKAWRERHPDVRVNISCFGFTYSISSEILLGVAYHGGGGSFNFIPDAACLGSSFVNFVAAAKTTHCINTKLTVQAKNGAVLDSKHQFVDDTLPVKQLEWGTAVRLGALRAGEFRDVTVRVDLSKCAAAAAGNDTTTTTVLDVFLELPDPLREESRKLRFSATLADINNNDNNTEIGAVGDARASLCWTLAHIVGNMQHKHKQQALDKLAAVKSHVEKLLAATTTADGKKNEFIEGFLADIGGRAAKAFSNWERWERWGRNYLRALFRAHQTMSCTNMFDAGLQAYGRSSPRFAALVEQGGRAFCALVMKPTTAENEKARTRAANEAAAAQAQIDAQERAEWIASMGYSDEQSEMLWSGGGCFAESCTVQTEDSAAKKKFSNIRRGDRLRMADGSFSTVKILVELRKARGDLVEFEDSGLLLTLNHPVRLGAGGLWERPLAVKSVATKKKQTAPAVFNVVFEQKPACGLLVNGVECVTYHHDIAELEHPFYSSDKIIERLRDCEGFEEGNVVVRAASLKK